MPILTLLMMRKLDRHLKMLRAVNQLHRNLKNSKQELLSLMLKVFLIQKLDKHSRMRLDVSLPPKS